MVGSEEIVYLFIISSSGAEPSVFLVERDAGLIEFPVLSFPVAVAGDERELARCILSATGLSVKVAGFLDPPPDVPLAPPAERFLVARYLDGLPNLVGSHVGWEWRPAAGLFSLQFAPKWILTELRAYMSV